MNSSLTHPAQRNIRRINKQRQPVALTRCCQILAALFLVSGCNANTPILIGFAAELTGQRSEVGVEARDGALLAVEEINRRGGINGRPLKLIVKDDLGEPETARQVDAELIDAGVTAIIGHITSQQSAAVFNEINRAEVVLISPTSASTEFTGQADYFFRTISDNDEQGKALANHIFQNRHLRQIVGVYDLNNRAFAEPQWQSVQTEFARLGGNSSLSFTFISGQTDLKSLMAEITAIQPNGVVFVASAVDTALMAQYGRQQGLAAPFFSSLWANTSELLEKGGQAVEGMELISVYNPQSPDSTVKSFVSGFNTRFRRNPQFPAVYSYEAVLLLAHALERTDGPGNNLPQALSNIKNFPGVQGPITINMYGDVSREIYISTVKNGTFEIIETISSTP